MYTKTKIYKNTHLSNALSIFVQLPVITNYALYPETDVVLYKLPSQPKCSSQVETVQFGGVHK